MKAPLLLLVAGADAATPLEVAHEFERKLGAAGVPHEQHIYDGAPHSFFDRTYEQWKDAGDDAWRRILDFVKRRS
jgi:carboxymethylenebutenolidase